MTERPISKSDILGAFERAYEKKLRSDQEVDWKGMFKVVPLVPEGTSIWARLLREKKVEAWTVLWAMIPPEDNGTITEENPKGRVMDGSKNNYTRGGQGQVSRKEVLPVQLG
jgi:hypothetical protein